MTASVCTQCGAMKIGALTRCTKCKYEAATDTDRAKALLLSDHHLDRQGLAAASASIQGGTPYAFDDTKVAELASGIAHAPVPSGIGMYMLVFGFVALLGMVGLMLFLVGRYLVGLVF